MESVDLARPPASLTDHLHDVLETVGILPWSADPVTLELTYVAPQLLQLLGRLAESQFEAGFRSRVIHPRDRARVLAAMRSASEKESVLEYRLLHAGGQSIWYEDRFRLVRSESGDRLVGALLDISERRRSETETAAIQDRNAKLETLAEVGRVATRVAHDFNNLLTLVMGNVELVLAVAEAGEPLNEEDVAALKRVLDAAERAGDFTRRLSDLDPGRQGRRTLIDAADALRGVQPLLAQTLGGPESLESDISPDLGELNLEPGQLEHMALNLMTSCATILDDSRPLLLSASRVRIDHLPASAIGEYSPGWHLRLRVDCPWLAPVEFAELYQPFRQRKVRRDNALSLAAVLASVVKGSGFVDVAPGQGDCRFDLCLPLADQQDEAPEMLRHGKRLRVMVCEQSRIERSYVTRALESFGHSVVADMSGSDSLREPRPSAESLDLLVIEEDQHQLAREMLGENHKLKVLMISSDGADGDSDAGEALDVQYLPRPFGNQELADYIDDLLD